ncbi:hypothetical protein BVX99_01490 [bacterium F16]|nr:hypothetical protein BVX99_01490 [bacterium F16]
MQLSKQVLIQINSRFDIAQLPPRVIAEHNWGDYCDAKDVFSGKFWKDLCDVQDWFAATNSLRFITDEAFWYYAPAMMSVCLSAPGDSDLLPEYFVEEVFRRWDSKDSYLSPSQVSLVKEVLSIFITAQEYEIDNNKAKKVIQK